MTKVTKVVIAILSCCMLLLVSIATATSVYCYRHRDEITQKVLTELNHRLETSVRVGEVSLEVIQAFPHVTLLFKDVVMLESTKLPKAWAKVGEVRCVLSLWRLLQGSYVFNELRLVRGEINVNGLLTYLSRKSSAQGSPSVVLNKLLLQDVRVIYHHTNQQQEGCRLKRVVSSLYWDGTKLKIYAKGNITDPYIHYGRQRWKPAWHPVIDAQLTYDAQLQKIVLQTAKLQQGRAELIVTGYYGLVGSPTPTHIQIASKRVPVSMLLKYSPNQYQGSELPWHSHISGTIELDRSSGVRQPISLQGKLLFNDTVYTTPYLTQPLIAVKEAMGRVCIPNLYDLTTARLTVDDISGVSLGSVLKGSLVLQDFLNPQLKCTAQGQIDLTQLNQVMGHIPLQKVSGRLLLDCQLESSLEALLQAVGEEQVPKLGGTLQVQSMQCTTANPQMLWSDINGQASFNNGELTVSTLSGSMESGTFSMSGSVQSFLPMLLGTTPAHHAHAKLYIDYLDLDTMLKEEGDNSSSMQLYFLPDWMVELTCDIQQIHYRRFRGKNVRSKLRIERQKLIVDQLEVGIAGGKGALTGCVTKGDRGYDVYTAMKLRGVDLQQLFYMCDNFYQDFLTDNHLSGEVLANGHLNLYVDGQGRVHWEKLQGAVDMQLHHGVLQDFPPIQRLAKYVPEKALTHIRFSPLKNHIKIQHGVIHIPPMEVHSSVTRMKLSGTHALDGTIDYRFEVPLTGLRPSTAFRLPEAVAEDALEHLNAYLRLKGTTTHYQVTHDVQAFKKGLKSKLKRHGQVIQQMLKGKYEDKKKTQELAPEDYFEFD